MRKCFHWLCAHEKLLVCVNVILIGLLVIQLKFCGSRVQPSTNISQASNVYADLTKQASGTVDKPPDSIINIAGTWDMNVQKKRGGTQTWTLKIDQHGEDLTGVINSEGGDLPVTGTIKGHSINLAAKRFGITLDVTAALNGDAMTGHMRALTVDLYWTGKRRP